MPQPARVAACNRARDAGLTNHRAPSSARTVAPALLLHYCRVEKQQPPSRDRLGDDALVRLNGKGDIFHRYWCVMLEGAGHCIGEDGARQTSSPRAGARSDQFELGAHLDTALEAAGDRTEARVEPVHALDLLAPVLRNGEPVVNGDAPDHEHRVLEHHLADRLDLVALRIDIDVTRLQRAGEGAGQSAAGGRHHVVERGRVWGVLVGADTVVLRDLGMDPERDRLVLGGQVREPLRSAQPLDLHTGYVRWLGRHHRRSY